VEWVAMRMEDVVVVVAAVADSWLHCCCDCKEADLT